MADGDLWWLFLHHREECSREFWQEVENRKAAGILSKDVALLAEFDKSKHLTLVSVGSLQSLADILGVDVDLSSEDSMREPVRTKALACVR